VAAVAVAGLAGCESKVGQAAVVDGQGVSESDVGQYITRSGPSQQALDAAGQQGTVSPRVQALNSLIQERVFSHTLRRMGVKHAASDLEAAHDEAASRLFGSTSTGAEFDAQLAQRATEFGFTDKYPPLVIRVAELEDLLINATRATSLSGLAAAVRKHPVPISVSGRYGTWDPDKLQLSTDANAGVPSFVTFGDNATAAPSGGSSQPANK